MSKVISWWERFLLKFVPGKLIEFGRKELTYRCKKLGKYIYLIKE